MDSRPDPPPVTELEEGLIHEGRVFILSRRRIRLPSGLEQALDVIRHPGAAAIAAVTTDGEMLLVRQYRAAVDRWMLEVPAGRLDPGEDPLAAARRELEEETGYRARSWSLLREFLPAPGFCDEWIHLFEARDLELVPDGGLDCDDDEELELVLMRPEEVLKLEPADAKTLVAAHLLLAGDAGPTREQT